MFRNILVAIDASETARRALQTAAELAEALNSRMTIIAVAQEVPSFAYRGGVDVGALEHEARDEMDKTCRCSSSTRRIRRRPRPDPGRARGGAPDRRARRLTRTPRAIAHSQAVLDNDRHLRSTQGTPTASRRSVTGMGEPESRMCRQEMVREYSFPDPRTEQPPDFLYRARPSDAARAGFSSRGVGLGAAYCDPRRGDRELDCEQWSGPRGLGARRSRPGRARRPGGRIEGTQRRGIVHAPPGYSPPGIWRSPKGPVIR